MAKDVKYLISLQDKFSGKLNTINKSTRNFDKSLGRTIGRFASFAAVGAILTNSVKKMADFEEQVSNLAAITGAAGEDLDFLKRKAIELGGATTKSSIDTVKAFKLIASAKPELLSNTAALAATTKEAIALSEASGLDLPTAATALTDSLNQFNLTADQSSRVINVLAAGSKFASAEIPDLTMSLKEFGGVADSLNISLEESAAAVETLSSKGLKGARAGIGLRNVFLKLGSSVNRKYKPQVVGLSEALKNLAPIQDDVTALKKMFGRQNVLAAQTLIKERQRLDELTDSMTDTNIAYEQAAINTDNLNSDFKRLGSSWEKFILNMNKGDGVISNTLRNAVQGVTKLIDALDDLNKSDEERATKGAEKEMENFLKTISGVTNESDFNKEIQKSLEYTEFLITKSSERIEKEGGYSAIKWAEKWTSVGHGVSRSLFPEKAARAFAIMTDKQRIASLEKYQQQILKMRRDGFQSKTADALGVPVDEKGLGKVEDQVQKITSAAPKTFNINIDKFVENFQVSSENITEGAGQVLDIFNKMWLKMLADAQAVGA